MSERLRVLCRLGCMVVLAASCAQSPPRAELPAPAPTNERSLCDRPALPPRDVADAKVNASFRDFTQGWIRKLREGSAATATPRQIGDGVELELRPTASNTAPYVGILRYCDQVLSCTTATTCQVSKSTVVTEIFRYQGGVWVY